MPFPSGELDKAPHERRLGLWVFFGANRRSKFGMWRDGETGMDEIIDREERLDKFRFERRELMLDHDLFYELFPEYQQQQDFDEEGFFSLARDTND